MTNIIDEDRIKELDTHEIEQLADTVMGFPLHATAGITPSLKISWLTLTPFASLTANLAIKNRIHPVVDINYLKDQGIALGAGLLPYGNKRRGASLAVGLGLKYFERNGIIGLYDVFGSDLANLINSDNRSLEDIKRSLGHSRGRGMGVDIGLDWRYRSQRFTFASGLSALDLFDTKIKVYQGDHKLPDQQMAINFGSSFTYNLLGLLDWTASLDLHPLGAKIDFSEKVHVGFRMGIPLLDFFGGYSGGQTSYGVALDLFPIEIAVGMYKKKTDSEDSRRLLAYISILDFSL